MSGNGNGQKFQPAQPVAVGVQVQSSTGNGYHVCVNPHVTGSAPPPAYQSNDNWRWVSK